MPRARNLKPSFFTNEDLGKLDDAACLLFAGLWVMADREGRLRDSADWIKAHIFPYKRRPVDALLGKLANAGFIQRYEVGGSRFIQILAFSKHQSPHVNEPQSTIPAPESYQSSTVPLSPSIERGNQQSGISNQESERGRGKFVPPTVSEVAGYCLERGNNLDAEAFVAHYESNGWKVGKNPMKNWHSAVVTWEKNHGSFSKQADSAAAQRPRAIRSIADDPS